MTLIKKSVFRLCAATAIFTACLPMQASAYRPDPSVFTVPGPKHWNCTAVTSGGQIVAHQILASSRDRAEALMRSLTNYSTVHCNG